MKNERKSKTEKQSEERKRKLNPKTRKKNKTFIGMCNKMRTMAVTTKPKLQ